VAGSITDALTAVGDFARRQRPDHLEPKDDTLTSLRYEVPVSLYDAALTAAATVVEAGGDVDLEWRVEEEGSPQRVALTNGLSPETWQVVDGEPALVRRLGDPGAPAPWTTDDLRRALEGAERGKATLAFSKEPWRTALRTSTGRKGVWVGPSAEAFGDWVARNPDTAITEVLGAEGGALVAVDDATADFDPAQRLVLVSPTADPQAVGDRSLLVERLEKAGRTDELPLWRAVDVDVPQDAPAKVAHAVGIAAAWAAARVIAGPPENGVLRPSLAAATEWTKGQRDAADAEPSAAIVGLARWLLPSFDETGLEVARAIASEKLPNPFTAHPAEPVVHAARIAYQVAIRNDVREALSQQNELEKSYLEADAEMTKLRESIASSVDQVVIRALTGALAVAIAALTAKQVRGWPVFIAGCVLALYLLVSAVYTMWPVRRAAYARLDSLGDIASGRKDLAATGIKQIGSEVENWRRQLERYVIVAFIVLVLLAAAAAVGGFLANDRVSPLFSDASPVLVARVRPLVLGSRGPPDPPRAASARRELERLKVAGRLSGEGYHRREFPHWIKQKDGCNTRTVVLIRDGRKVTTDGGCRVVAGSWRSYYDGLVVTNPGALDIDHIVPLKNAWRSGARRWTRERRREFANDLESSQLIAVTAATNRSKGDRGPEKWKPPRQEALCRYARWWVEVKSHWRLSVVARERTELRRMLATC
jgi:hypothetical protein